MKALIITGVVLLLALALLWWYYRPTIEWTYILWR